MLIMYLKFFFFFQRIGYLAASQSFHEDLDILMLTTNMIRKVLLMFFASFEQQWLLIHP